MNLNFAHLPLKLLAIFFVLTACNPRLQFMSTNPSAQPHPEQQEHNDSPIENSKDVVPTETAALPAPVSITSNNIDSSDEPEVSTLSTELKREVAAMNEEPDKAKQLPEKKVVAKPQASNEHGPNMDTEFFQYTSGTKVDILFIVDNSPSMHTEQSKLGRRLQSFMNGIKDMDWQIAFTTSDVSKGKFGVKGSLLDISGYPNQKILDKNVRDYETVFKNTVQRSDADRCFLDCPSSNEQPLKASILAMEKSRGENADFFRLDANLAIIILSDEDEMSRGSPKATKPNEVINAFHSIFGPTKKLSVYGIVIEPNDNNCYAAQKTEGFSNAAPGTHVTELAKLTNGITRSICDEDYAVSLEKIGEQTRLMSDIYKLKRIPITDSLKVKLLPEQEIAWKLEKNLLTLVPPPKEGTLVQVTYRYSL